MLRAQVPDAPGLEEALRHGWEQSVARSLNGAEGWGLDQLSLRARHFELAYGRLRLMRDDSPDLTLPPALDRECRRIISRAQATDGGVADDAAVQRLAALAKSPALTQRIRDSGITQTLLSSCHAPKCLSKMVWSAGLDAVQREDDGGDGALRIFCREALGSNENDAEPAQNLLIHLLRGKDEMDRPFFAQRLVDLACEGASDVEAAQRETEAVQSEINLRQALGEHLNSAFAEGDWMLLRTIAMHGNGYNEPSYAMYFKEWLDVLFKARGLKEVEAGQQPTVDDADRILKCFVRWIYVLQHNVCVATWKSQHLVESLLAAHPMDARNVKIHRCPKKQQTSEHALIGHLLNVTLSGAATRIQQEREVRFLFACFLSPHSDLRPSDPRRRFSGY